MVGTLNPLCFQKVSKCYEHLGKHQTETRRKGVCYKNITDCWDMVIDQNLACPVEPGLGGVLRAVLWQSSNLAIIYLNKQTQKNTTVQEWDIM